MQFINQYKLIRRSKYKVENIFTPAKAADVNYIKRPEIDKQLSSEMSIPGKQIIVFGDSGSGKTSSVRNMLKVNGYKFIRTQCENNTTFERLLLDAFDQLDVFIKSHQTYKHTRRNNKNLKVEYNSIKASISNERLSEENTTYSRLLPPQLTPQKLAKFMGESKVVWVIEDLHKVSIEDKTRIADVIKIFVDNANDYPISKIICIGVCQSAQEFIALNPNLRTRVSEISVPLLSDYEIEQLIVNGFNLLNVSLK